MMRSLAEVSYLYGARESFVYPKHKIITREAPDKSQYMVAFGVGDHTRDPYNPLLEVILYEWDEFLSRTRDHSLRGVITEGFKRHVPADDLKPKPKYAEFVRRGGENLLVTGLATEGKLPVFSSEPSKTLTSQEEIFVEIADIIDIFPIDATVAYYCMRLGPQLHISGIVEAEVVQRNIEKQLSRVQKSLQSDSRFRNYEFSYENFLAYFFDTYKRPFSVSTKEDAEFLRKETYINYISPTNTSQVSQISKVVNVKRDSNNLNVHKKLWVDGWSIFSMQNSVHLSESGLNSLGVHTDSSETLNVFPMAA